MSIIVPRCQRRQLQRSGDLSFVCGNEKLTIHSRVDYIRLGGDGLTYPTAATRAAANVLGNAAFAGADEFLAVTVTADYQL